MPSNVAQYLLVAFLCLASVVSADYYRFSTPQTKCDETREWDTDHLQQIINLVAGNQNITRHSVICNGTIKGASYYDNDAWKDITLTGDEPNLTVTFSIFNVGDSDPQSVALNIISLILEIPTRIPVLGAVATAVDSFLSLFTDAYRCEGPVAIKVPVYSQDDLSSMAYGKAYCSTEQYSYQTGKGCVNIDPLTSKTSKYTVTSCLERFQGTSTAGGGHAISAAEPRWNTKSSLASPILAVMTVFLFTLF